LARRSIMNKVFIIGVIKIIFPYFVLLSLMVELEMSYLPILSRMIWSLTLLKMPKK